MSRRKELKISLATAQLTPITREETVRLRENSKKFASAEALKATLSQKI